MSRYVFRAGVHPHFYYASLDAGGPAIADALAEVIEDVVALESRPSPQGGEVLQVALHRPTHTEAFEDVARAVAQAGYSMVEAEVSEIVDEAATGAMVGLLSGGAPGALADNPLIAFLGAAVGWWAGREVGGSIRKVGAVHRYQFFSAAGWVHTKVTDEIQDPAQGVGQDKTGPKGTPRLSY